MKSPGNRLSSPTVAVALALATLMSACSTACSASSTLTDSAPPTVESARPAAAPPPAKVPAGEVIPLASRPTSALFDARTATLVTLDPAALTVFGRTGEPRVVELPAGVTAITGDGSGTAWAVTRGAVITVDLASGRVSRSPVAGQADADFTAIARRADGRLVLGSADGAVFTLADDLSVAREAADFARVDALVTVGNTAVVLDRGQTSVTELDADGSRRLALRAGLGATTIAADPAGRVLVTDTRGGQLLVFSVDPLIERQAYPVPDSPFALAGSARMTWVSQTATNTVIGYDLATGIPVERVRYPTVQQPNSLAFDDSSGTLYVVSGSGAGVQVIRNADGRR